MGTELHYVLNPLATLQKRNVDTLNAEGNTAKSWDCSRVRYFKENLRTSFHKLRESMDRTLEQYNRESVRRMMLNQEKIFREQVQELHRVYRVQKTLMAELKSHGQGHHVTLANAVSEPIHLGSDYRVTEAQTGYWSTALSSQTSHSSYSNTHRSATHMSFDYNFQQTFNVKSDPGSNKESSCSRYTSTIQRGFDLEQAAEEQSSEFSFRRDPTSSFREDTKDKMATHASCADEEESDVELTLSIGRSTDKEKLKHHSHSNVELGCSELTPNETRQLMPSTSARLDREEESSDASAANYDQEGLKQPHWLFQNLRLNRT